MTPRASHLLTDELKEWAKKTRERSTLMLTTVERVETGERLEDFLVINKGLFRDSELPDWDFRYNAYALQPKQEYRPWANLPEFLEDSAQDMWFLSMDVESVYHNRAMRVQGIEMSQEICINFGAMTCGFSKLYRDFVCSQDLTNWKKCGRNLNP